MKKQLTGWLAAAILVMCIAVGLLIHLQHKEKLRQIGNGTGTHQSVTEQLLQKDPAGYLPIFSIETTEKFGSYYVWFYNGDPISSTQGFSIEVTREQLKALALLRQIVMTKVPLNLSGNIKKIFESEVIQGITIDATSGTCAAQAFVRNGSSDETICLPPIPMVSLYIILIYRRYPMPHFYAKESLFEDINKEKKVQI